MVDKSDNVTDEPTVSDAYAELNRQEPLSPPASVDAAILAEARRAVGAGPKAARSKIYRWAPPLAMAATVVLTATLVVLQPKDEMQSGQGFTTNSAKENEQFAEITQEKKSRSKPTAAVAKSKQPPVVSPAATLAGKTAPASAQGVQSKQAAADSVATNRKLEEAVTGLSLEDMQSFSIMAESESDSGVAEQAEISREAPAGPQVSSLSPVADEESREPQDPEQWRKDIDKLLEEKNWVEADRQFDLFKERFPAHEFVERYQQLRKERAEP